MAELSWDMLDRAPFWLGLPEAALATFECQVGAMLCAPALRLWIDGPRLAAARAALGDAFLQTLLAQPDADSIPIGLIDCPRIDAAGQVSTLLQATGAAVLLASMPHGALRRAADKALAPAEASPMAEALAHALVARAQGVAAGAGVSEHQGSTEDSVALRSAA